MDNQTLVVTFPDSTLNQANKYAQALQDDLKQLSGISVERRRERDDTQDFGATLVLVLGTASITALAKGLATWLRRSSGAKIEITMPDGRKVKASNLESPDAAVIAKAMSAQAGK